MITFDLTRDRFILFIIIGNEILSGRTQDTNTGTLSLWLNSLGIKVQEVRIVPDIEETIIKTVSAYQPRKPIYKTSINSNKQYMQSLEKYFKQLDYK